MATSADWVRPADVGCYIKQLPERLGVTASQTARDIFPANAPGNRALPEGVISPQNIAILTTKYWGPSPRTLTGELAVYRRESSAYDSFAVLLFCTAVHVLLYTGRSCM